MPYFTTRIRGAALAASVAFMSAAAPASAAAPTVTFSSDRGSTTATVVSGCTSPKLPPTGVEPPAPGPATCGDGTIVGSPPLEMTAGTPITVRASQATGPATIVLFDAESRPFTNVATEALDDLTFRFDLPSNAPTTVYSSFGLRWEDETSRGDASYAVRLVQIAPPAPPTLAPTADPSRLRLSGLKRTTHGARLKLKASHAGRVRLVWRAGNRTRTRAFNVTPGTRTVHLVVPRRARRVSIRGTLTPGGAVRDSRTTASFRLPS